MSRCCWGTTCQCPQHPHRVPHGGTGVSGVSPARPKDGGHDFSKVKRQGREVAAPICPSDTAIPLGLDKPPHRRLCFCRKAGGFLIFLIGSPAVPEMRLLRRAPRNAAITPQLSHNAGTDGLEPCRTPSALRPFKQRHMLHVHVCYHLPLPGDDLGPTALQRNPIKDVATSPSSDESHQFIKLQACCLHPRSAA